MIFMQSERLVGYARVSTNDQEYAHDEQQVDDGAIL